MAIVTEQETWVQLIESLGKRRRLTQPDDSGGEGVVDVVSFRRSTTGAIGVELEFDDGYSYLLQHGARLEAVEDAE